MGGMETETRRIVSPAAGGSMKKFVFWLLPFLLLCKASEDIFYFYGDCCVFGGTM